MVGFFTLVRMFWAAHYVITRGGTLYRLSISEHAPNFLLKGALLFQLWYGQPHRPTRDADLLGFGPDDVPTLVSVFRSIASIPGDDGVVFDPQSVAGAPIRKDAGYGGVRIDLRATLDGVSRRPSRSGSSPSC